MSPDALECTDLCVGYRGDAVLTGLSFTCPQASMLGVIGPNGAGKTTLLRAITGLLKPQRGAIRLFGKETSRLSAPERARLVGVVPQEVETPVSYTVNEIVHIGRTALRSRWRPADAQDRKIVERAMVYADVAEMKQRPFSELSGGEKQRVIIAMVLAQQPRLILMDEPTSHLDMNHRLEVMQIIERLNADHGVSVLLISHDLNLAADFCQRLLLLDHGRRVCEGPPADVLDETVLREVYHCDVSVRRDASGGRLTVTPQRKLPETSIGSGRRVHVVCGGGSGAETLRRLSLCGFDVSCGVLNRGDTDAQAADALDIAAACEKPFSPVGAEAYREATVLVDRAETVVVCGVPFGPGNLVNLDLARSALVGGKRVLIMAGVDGRDYTDDHTATRTIRALIEQGAEGWSSIADLVRALAERPAL